MRRLYPESSGNGAVQHQVKVTRNVLQEECSEMLKDFFRQLRVWKKEEKERKKALLSEHTEA